MPYVWFTILCIAHSGSNCKNCFPRSPSLADRLYDCYVVNILMCFYEKGYARICRMAAIAPYSVPYV